MRVWTSAATSKSPPLPWLPVGVFLGSLAPLAAILVEAYQGSLGANPIAEAENQLGLSALIFLVTSLACTPARRVLGWTWAVRLRRQLGLFAFFYASLHFLTYLVLDQGVDWGAIIDDIYKRPFITVGVLAFLLLVPLALTSTTESIRQLGFRRWNRIHQLAYVAGGLAVIHFVWRVKIDVSQPLLYAGVLAALLAVRVGFWARKRRQAQASSSTRTRSPRERKPAE
jgi:methionine sulfoxide reductase heme-binding subunit